MWTRASDFDRMLGAMDLFRNRMNRLFSDFDRSYDKDFDWRPFEGGPLTNLSDTGGHLKLAVELPGILKEDITLRIQGNYVEISGEKKAELPKGYKAHRLERGTSSFTRSFTLPMEVDAERVEAVLKEGILTLSLPKAEAAKLKQITIK
ncbi:MULTISPECIES: Hsp20/alpha crystallin family protein [Desulfosediminicola]|uniref:Hsp20/alpha crystallin family protein n=1 Tax=Desulfosediminicola TaxID=2886823 RepID=UPI0010AC5704|nr:Hsp20/alpha crystallin family protein [Desulfosediminicola ganghwensis]